MGFAFFDKLFGKKEKKSPELQRVEDNGEVLKATLLAIESEFIEKNENVIPINSTLLMVYDKRDELTEEDINRPLIDSIRISSPLDHPIEGRAYEPRNQAVIDAVRNLKDAITKEKGYIDNGEIINDLMDLVSVIHVTINGIDKLLIECKNNNDNQVNYQINILNLLVFDGSKEVLIDKYRMQNKVNTFDLFKENFTKSIEEYLEINPPEEKSEKIIPNSP